MTTCGTISKTICEKYQWTVNLSDVNSSDQFISPQFLMSTFNTTLKLIVRSHSEELCTYKISAVVPKDFDTNKTSLEFDLKYDSNKILACVRDQSKNLDSLVLSEVFYVKSSFHNKLNLDIECKLFSIEPELIEKNEFILTPSTDQDSLFWNGFEELLDSGKFSDLTIEVDDTVFSVHKSVLYARSKVFAAMLKEHTKECQESKIKIDDISVDTMKEVLKFIYTGEVQNIEKNAYELVAPADKYELQDLLQLCEKVLVNNITLDNIKPMLTLINLFNLNSLKSKVFKIIQNNPKLTKTKDFTDFLQNLSPSLLTEIITYTIHKASYA